MPRDALTPNYEEVAEFYDLFADNSDIPFYLEYAKKVGGPILDIAAGTGRVSIELARNGFDVVSLEKSPSMLAVARMKLENLPQNMSEKMRLVEGSMVDFAIDCQFPMIVIPASFGHAMTTEEQLSTLQCIKKHLSEDGLFILDLFPGGRHLATAEFEDSPKRLDDGRIVRRKGRTTPDPIEQILKVELVYEVESADGMHRERIGVESGAAIIFNREANLLIRMTGFRIVEEFGTFDKAPYHSDASRRILVLKHDFTE